MTIEYGMMAVLLSISLFIAILNIWYYRHRASLTAEELAIEDEDFRRETRIW